MQSNLKWILGRGCQQCLHPSTNCPSRTFTLRPRTMSHYDNLGVTPAATQGEIKAAYYKLSKIYHPDTNEGSKEAAERFRVITEAYETIGNVQKRRMYDRGVIFDGGSADTTETEEQAAVSKFYKSRGTTYSGKTPIYDFDEWSRNHYNKTFERREKAKAKYAYKTTSNVTNTENNNSLILIAFFGLSAIIFGGYLADHRDRDVDRISEKRVQR